MSRGSRRSEEPTREGGRACVGAEVGSPGREVREAVERGSAAPQVGIGPAREGPGAVDEEAALRTSRTAPRTGCCQAASARICRYSTSPRKRGAPRAPTVQAARPSARRLDRRSSTARSRSRLQLSGARLLSQGAAGASPAQLKKKICGRYASSTSVASSAVATSTRPGRTPKAREAPNPRRPSTPRNHVSSVS